MALCMSTINLGPCWRDETLHAEIRRPQKQAADYVDGDVNPGRRISGLTTATLKKRGNTIVHGCPRDHNNQEYEIEDKD